jgi:hypothetical protein
VHVFICMTLLMIFMLIFDLNIISRVDINVSS